MKKQFSPAELLKVAVNVEEKGQALFENLENQARDLKIKAVWKYLKEQESVHQEVFQEMLDNIGDYVVDDFSPGEYEAYLKAIASEYILTPELIEKKAEENFSNDLEAVHFGIQIEKDSILTYSALREFINSDKQHVLDKVIEEEKGHLVKLTSLKEMLES